MPKLGLTLPLLLLLTWPNLFTLNLQPLSAKSPCQNISGIPGEDSVMTGSVAVRKAANGNIVVIIDSALNTQTSPDGVPDLVYRFAPLPEDTQRYNEIALNLEQAQIFSQAGRLAVVTRDHHVVLSLSLEEITKDDISFPTYGDSARDLRNTVRLTSGIGLVRQIPQLNAAAAKSANLGRKVKPAKLPALIDLEADFVVHPGAQLEAGTSCQSGGEGATQCGISCPGGGGCSITCGVGYWSCCNCPNSCKCIDKGLIQ